MSFAEWFASQAVFLALICFLHHVGVIEVELWLPKWLTDSVPDLPDAASFYQESVAASMVRVHRIPLTLAQYHVADMDGNELQRRFTIYGGK